MCACEKCKLGLFDSCTEVDVEVKVVLQTESENISEEVCEFDLEVNDLDNNIAYAATEPNTYIAIYSTENRWLTALTKIKFGENYIPRRANRPAPSKAKRAHAQPHLRADLPAYISLCHTHSGSLTKWLHGVVVSAPDSASCVPSSHLGETCKLFTT